MKESEKLGVKKSFSLKGDADATVARQSSTSRIARNTLFLYFRQILIMLVSLYTVRAVLATLGAEDYGIYNVVAGVVVMFGFVNNAMATSVQRYLTFFIGKNDSEKTQVVFSKSLVIHGLICMVFVLLAETAGLWFLRTKLNIPAGRSAAAFWCYQAAVATTIASIIRVPYNAVIIAYERMSFFAGLSVIEALLKLAVVFLLVVSPFDKLVAYSFLLAAVALLILAVYKLYCGRNFETARYRKSADKGLGKELVAFSGWSLFGAAANVANSQGTNIVLNIFTNVTVNAAMGIANQVNAAVYSFVGNFQTAFNPQIVKSWAAGETEAFRRLLVKSAKFSFFLLWLLVLPLYVNAEFVLSLWLKDVPEHTVSFVRLILVWSLVESVNGPLFMAVQAAGKIRLYQVVIGAINLFNLPLTIIAFSMGASPEWLLYIRIVLNIGALVFRILFCRRMTSLPARLFLAESIFKPFLIALFSFALTMIVGKTVRGLWTPLFATCAVSFAATSILVIFIGMSRSERTAIFSKVLGIFR